jgi:integrase
VHCQQGHFGFSGYWKWLATRGIATENVWQGMLLPKVKPQDGAAKRPYSDQELSALLTGKSPSAALKDAMLIAALSAMRVDELCSLRVGDIKGDLIDLGGTKTEAVRRVVPIHADLMSTIARRCDGKDAAAFLFDELPTPPADSARERSQPIVKAFTRYRRGAGVDERGEGARQSNVDFHSFRRWFIRKARDAVTSGAATGYSPWTIAEVVGHSKEDSLPLVMTMSRYSGDDTVEAKRACVAAVRLPARCGGW